MFLDKLKKNSDIKNLIVNFISLGLINTVNFIVPILIIPLLIKKVGVDNYGKYAFVFGLIFYFLNFTQFGFSLTAVRDIAKNKNDLTVVNSIYNKVQTTKLYILFICFIILLVLTFSIDKLADEKFLVLTTFLIVVGDAIGATWLFQGMEKMKYITLINVFSKITYVGLVLIFINNISDYKLIGFLQSIGFLISGICTFILAKKQFGVNFKLEKLKNVIYQIKYSFNSFITLVLPLLYVNTSTLIIGFLGLNKEVAYFDTSYKVSNALVSFNQILTNALYPFVSRKNNIFKYVSILLISIGGITSIISFHFSELIITNFFGENLKESIIPLKILSLSPLFLSIRSAFGINYLLVNNYDKIYMKIAMFSSMFSFLIGAFVIYKWHSIGAAIIVVLAQGIYSLLSMFYALKYLRNDKKNTIR